MASDIPQASGWRAIVERLGNILFLAPLLRALLARLTVFVAADSGPMHLGAAAGTPVVGLFKATPAAAYAPMGRNCVALEGAEPTPEKAAAETAERAA